MKFNRIVISFLLFLIVSVAPAQEEQPVKVNGFDFRAVIVGVSDYKNLPEDKQLQYADDDAVAFYNFLSEHKEVKKENLKLITNQDATADVVRRELYMTLLRDAQPNDRVILYFAGHGDVDPGIDDGFLLMHEVSQQADYFIDDAIPISDIQRLVRRASTKGVKVILISDACRSGKMLGGEEGSSLTTRNLMQNWENTVKLVSCQPNQYSFEDIRWGQGHGVFTYYLLEGLKGAADEDGSGYFTLGEVYDYVKYEVKVATERSQIPKASGNDLFVMMRVDKLGEAKSSLDYWREPNFMSPLWPRPHQINLSVGDNDLLQRFEKAVQDNRLIRPQKGYVNREDEFASDLYAELQKTQEFDQLEDYLKGLLNVALQKSAQDMISPFVQGDRVYPSPIQIDKAINELRYCESLFQEEPFFLDKVKSKRLFLEGYRILVTNDVPQYGLALTKFEEIAQLQPNASFPFLGMSAIYEKKMEYSHSKKKLNEALKKSPSWTELRSQLGQVYKEICNCDFAEKEFEKIIAINPNSTKGYVQKAGFKVDFGAYVQADSLYSKALKIDSTDASIYSDYGFLKSLKGEHNDAISLFEKGIQVNESYYKNYLHQGNLKLSMLQDVKGDAKYEFIETGKYYLGKALSLAPYEPETYVSMGNYYLQLLHNDVTNYVGNISGLTNSLETEDVELNYESISAIYGRALKLDPYNVDAYAGLGWCNLNIKNDTVNALRFFLHAVELNPGHQSYINLHTYYLAVKDFKEAERALLEGLKHDERNYDIYIKLYTFYKELGIKSKTLKTENEIKALFPDSFVPE